MVPSSTTGLPAGTVGLIARGGREQAHDVVVAVVEAVVAGDESLLSRYFAERVGSFVTAAGVTLPRVTTERATLIRQVLTAARAARLSGTESAASLVEAGSLVVEPVADVLPVPLPADLLPTDLVVRFRVTPMGRRALAVIAPSGAGLLIVRPGAEPQIVAR